MMLIQADSLHLPIRSDSVQCIVTSPPFWGLRDYNARGQIGLERTPEEYVEKMVQVFREVWRVLRKDGTVWLNLGDSYATGAGKVGDCPGGGEQGERWKGHRGIRVSGKQEYVSKAMGPLIQPNRLPIAGLKPKDLVGIPWRVAFALQADGWWLRMDNIWAKPNPMPESVTDRPTKSHEYVFLLSKSERYFYDAEAIKEEAEDWGTRDRSRNKYQSDLAMNAKRSLSLGADCNQAQTGRNKRSVWTIATQPWSGAHFATFPEKLVEPCILAGSRPGDLVLDPFVGSGTAVLVARRLRRRGVGCDLRFDYLSQQAVPRIEAVQVALFP